MLFYANECFFSVILILSRQFYGNFEFFFILIKFIANSFYKRKL